ncbi:hypothetical protein NA57DRAFT_72885 [Rhizodiscina lignyota]|uniref:Uncharacterized protein n=1 Tax=Rhizodiscina lignyota TaxID=1504668 RepID=A0A9P4MBJ0_9PEZI|nr:hypothetical protein NA57DRAFT_72885 [Rhizodiscina lignyota]
MFEIIVSVGSGQWPVDYQILQMNLPRVARIAATNGGYIDVNILIRDSDLVHSNYITPHQMLYVWEMVVKGLSERSGDCSGLSLALRDLLGDELLRDKTYLPDPMDAMTSQYPKTLNLFMCLAEISSLSESRRIASSLASFFNKHGEEIVRRDWNALDHWGVSIMNARMPQPDLINCMREFLTADPALLDEVALQNPRPAVGNFLEALRRIDFHQAQSVELAFPSRGRGFFRGFGPSFGANFGSVGYGRPPLMRSRSVPPYGYPDAWDMPPFDTRIPRKRYNGSPLLMASTSDPDLDILHRRINKLEDKVDHELGPPTLRTLPGSRSVSPGWGLGVGGFGRRRFALLD